MPQLSRSTISRRQFLTFPAAAAAAGLAFYSGLWERHRIEVVRPTIRIRNLPPPFYGFRIAQISDIHYDEYTEPYFVRDVVRRVNALAPDLLVMTGDFVSYGPLPRHVARNFSDPCAHILSGISCTHRYAVMGNHDAMVGWPAVRDALQRHGIPVLLNSAVAIRRDGARLWLAGTRDAEEDYPHIPDTLPARNQTEPVILLVHEPDYARAVAARGGVDLMLSGHTHGGQVRFPFIGTPSLVLPPMGREFIAGHFTLGALQLYVNRGIGTVGLPIRFNCPPEITLFTLQPA